MAIVKLSGFSTCFLYITDQKSTMVYNMPVIKDNAISLHFFPWRDSRSWAVSMPWLLYTLTVEARLYQSYNWHGCKAFLSDLLYQTVQQNMLLFRYQKLKSWITTYEPCHQLNTRKKPCLKHVEIRLTHYAKLNMFPALDQDEGTIVLHGSHFWYFNVAQ